MATSPTDQGNKNIIAWLDRLQASVRDQPGGKPIPGAFRLDARDGDSEEGSSSDAATAHKPRMTHAQKFGLVDDDLESTLHSHGGSASGDDDDEPVQSSLPDSHVPLGLIANLSLSNNSHSTKLRAKAYGKDKSFGKEEAASLLLEEENLDDDNVGVASETYFMPGES
jgi:hypothetical protein